MAEPEDPIVIPIKADFGHFSAAMEDMRKQTTRFGSTFASTISSAVRSGKSFEDILKSMAMRLSDMALQAGLKPLETMASSLFGQFASGLSSTVSGALGSNAPVIPFAKGGVVSAPTFFGMGGATGLMGEAGAEAIMPLARGANGLLGVQLSGGAKPVNVTFNVTTPDAASFRKSEGQLSAMLARTVGRGRRNL